MLSLQEQLAAASAREEGLVRAKRAVEEELSSSRATFDAQVAEYPGYQTDGPPSCAVAAKRA